MNRLSQEAGELCIYAPCLFQPQCENISVRTNVVAVSKGEMLECEPRAKRPPSLSWRLQPTTPLVERQNRRCTVNQHDGRGPVL
jgi:hypothetical protein